MLSSQGKTLFVIGSVWPEPTSSAAGRRMLQLLDAFIKNGTHIHFASAAKKTDFSFDLKDLGVEEHTIILNDSTFDVLIASINPSIVLFDRFMIEEQYSWRVMENCPNALRILDTEDLHFLRFAREKAYQRKTDLQEQLLNDITFREIAAILRSDLSLIISNVEIILLRETFQTNPTLLYELPFMESPLIPQHLLGTPGFDERQHFAFIGNFIHEPNWQTVLLLKKDIWPKIRKRNPKAQLHIYGAYPSAKVLQLHNGREGFHILGRAENAIQTLQQYRILLAPIPFGAGIKGKFLDAIRAGTPFITTNVGAESIVEQGKDTIAVSSLENFHDVAAELYENETAWQQEREKNKQQFNSLYDKTHLEQPFINHVNALQKNLAEHRRNNFLGQLISRNSQLSTKYMSLWIEEKNKAINKEKQ